MSRIVLLLALLMLGVGPVHADPARTMFTRQFVETYAQAAFLNYTDAADTARALETAVQGLVDSPSTETLAAARQAWLAARVPYGQSEVFRFADGPIDGVNAEGFEGPEGRINAWPLNEAYIDYVQDDPEAGIISKFDTPITEETLAEKNQSEDEADVTTGFHAIEFLLWGQDFSTDGPGARPVADYTEENPAFDRRQEYLEAAASLLVNDLTAVAEAWAPDAENYRKTFLGLPGDEALTRALSSLATLSGFELASERLGTALDSGDQEDEQSCFSDNTHVDLIMNAKGIDNVYYGRYGAYQGTGLDSLARVADPELARKIDAQLAETRTIVESIAPPIDRILSGPANSEGRRQLEALVASLQAQAELFKELGAKLGLTIAIKVNVPHIPCAVLAVLCALASGCASPRNALSGGEGTVFDVSNQAFTLPMSTLPTEKLRVFAFGNRLFNTNWVTAPSSTSKFDGLGPTFNRVSCSACHTFDGRGRPPQRTGDSMDSMLVRLSILGQGPHGSVKPHPVYGDQLNDRAIPGIPAEGRAVIHYSDVNGKYPDGEEYSLRVPYYEFKDLAFGPLGEDIMFSPRVAPAVMGLGLLETVEEKTILGFAKAQEKNAFGISGRPNYVWDDQQKKTVIGRFGWKANQPSLAQQDSSALLGDIGITNPLIVHENLPAPQEEAARAKSGGSPEMDENFFAKLLFYSRTLGVPARRDADDPRVVRGERLFTKIGCAVCHVPEMQTGPNAEVPQLANQKIRPYSDLLLHDMGEGLADGRQDFRASGNEWRTPPLWGIGLVKTVNRHTFFLHDGRARSLEEAVLWHGGEGQMSKDKFKRLSKNERRQLLEFLESL